MQLSGIGIDTDTIEKIFIHNSIYTAWYPMENFKPILKPLSELKTHFDNYRSQIYSDFDYYIRCIKSGIMEYSEYDWFFENHYDVFGLIEQGLAVDINTI